MIGSTPRYPFPASPSRRQYIMTPAPGGRSFSPYPMPTPTPESVAIEHGPMLLDFFKNASFEQALQKEQEEQQKKELEEEERAEKRRKEKEMLKGSSDSSSGKKAKIDSVNGSESSDGSVSDGKKIETKS